MFIAGLPRSRTAWLSVFMSQSKTHFYHEAVNGCNSLEEYRDKIKGCGDSSTGLVSLGVDIIKGAKVVVIDKTTEEIERCIEWCDHTYGMDSRSFILGTNSKLKALDGLHVMQSDINNRLDEIWAYLVDDEWDERYGELINLNIQVKSHSIDKEAAKALYESIQQNL